MDIGMLFMALTSVALLVMLISLFIWLTSGFFDPGFGLVAFGIGGVFLFFVFGWVLIIIAGAIAMVFAGFLMAGSE